MWKHANLQSANRRIEAMSAMQELHYHGDAGKWKIDFLSRAREVYASHASIEHYIMQCAFNSFEGKCQPLQAKITEDINNDDLVGEGMNLEALASKYGAFLAIPSTLRRTLAWSESTPPRRTRAKNGVSIARAKLTTHATVVLKAKPRGDATTATARGT